MLLAKLMIFSTDVAYMVAKHMETDTIDSVTLHTQILAEHKYKICQQTTI